VTGLVMDNRMDETYYENSAKLVGTPYVFVYRYDPVGADGKRIYYLFKMYDHYGYPYNTEVILDGNDIKQENITYHWEDWLVHPKLNFGINYQEQMWLICESVLESPPANYEPNKTTPNYLTIYQFDHVQARFELYIKPSLFEKSAQKSYMPYRYRSEYQFITDMIFIQQNATTGYIELINLFNENTGIAYSFDLNSHGNPRYISTFWK